MQLIKHKTILASVVPQVRIYPNRTIRLQPGAPLKLHCEVEAATEANVSWFINNVTIKNSVVHRIVENITISTLSLTKVIQSGNYLCKGETVAGANEAEVFVNVTGTVCYAKKNFFTIEQKLLI